MRVRGLPGLRIPGPRIAGLRTLRLRMLAGFGLVIAISLLLAGFASVWLLRDQQANWAEQRIGRLVPRFSEFVTQMELFGWQRERIRAELVPWALYYDVRIMVIDGAGAVTVDTDDQQPMLGEPLNIAARSFGGVSPAEGMQAFHTVRAHGQDLYLFTPSAPLPMVTAGVSLRQLEETVVIAVPATDVTSAWAQLLPGSRSPAGWPRCSRWSSACCSVPASRDRSRP